MGRRPPIPTDANARVRAVAAASARRRTRTVMGRPSMIARPARRTMKRKQARRARRSRGAAEHAARSRLAAIVSFSSAVARHSPYAGPPAASATAGSTPAQMQALCSRAVVRTVTPPAAPARIRLGTDVAPGSCPAQSSGGESEPYGPADGHSEPCAHLSCGGPAQCAQAMGAPSGVQCDFAPGQNGQQRCQEYIPGHSLPVAANHGQAQRRLRRDRSGPLPIICPSRGLASAQGLRPSPQTYGHRRARRSPSYSPKILNFQSGHHPAPRNPSLSPTSSRSMIPTSPRSTIPTGPRTPRSGRSGWSRCSRRMPPLEDRMPSRLCRPHSCRSRRSTRRRSPDSLPRRTALRRHPGPTRRRRRVRCRCSSYCCYRTTIRRTPPTRRHRGSRWRGSRRRRTQSRYGSSPPRMRKWKPPLQTRACPLPGEALLATSDTSADIDARRAWSGGAATEPKSGSLIRIRTPVAFAASAPSLVRPPGNQPSANGRQAALSPPSQGTLKPAPEPKPPAGGG